MVACKGGFQTTVLAPGLQVCQYYLLKGLRSVARTYIAIRLDASDEVMSEITHPRGSSWSASMELSSTAAYGMIFGTLFHNGTLLSGRVA